MPCKLLPKYARVIVNITARALNHPFTYSVPAELAAAVKVGSVVEAPFRTGKLVGFVVSLDQDLTEDALGHEIKPLTRLLDEAAFWGQEICALTQFMSSYYGCLWLEAIQTVVPSPVLKKVVQRLKANGKVHPRPLLPPQAALAGYAAPQLTAQQCAAVQAIQESCQGGPPVLLYGVTGSGKTEVYLHAVAQCLAEGRQAVVLVPELSLTHQAIQRYRGRLGDTVGVLHSALSASERQAYWWAMHDGELQVALGTRSAVFAPLDNIGLFVIDEEHESSYKQENSPRYHARQIAFKRAQSQGAGLVLGSATPSIESYYLAKQGRYRLATMSERPSGHRLPEVHLVDMRQRRRRTKMLSAPLVEAIRQRLADGQQVVLFLNRRGFSKYLQCGECGHRWGCPHCSIPLTFHKQSGVMRCHYCGYEETPPDCCPECQGVNFRHGGGGTERLMHEVQELAPGVRVARMDRDTTERLGAHERILSSFEQGEAQILLGTKMITKGLDYPNVTLVGIVNGDDELNVPDFRAAERCFQMLTQVSGRAGRGELPGEVYLQVYAPDQLAIQAAINNDYLSLYESELKLRRQLLYPPFCRLVRVLISSESELDTASWAAELGEFMRHQAECGQVIGPAPCPLERLKNKHRYQLLAKCPAVGGAVACVEGFCRAQVRRLERSRVSVVIDPEPQSLS